MIPAQLSVRPDPPLAHNSQTEVDARVGQRAFVLEVSALILAREPGISRHLSRSQVGQAVEKFIGQLKAASNFEDMIH